LKDWPASLEDCPDCVEKLVKAEVDNLVGQSLDDKYDIIDVIARGGMGVVYRARQRFLEREVALKVLRGDQPGDAVASKRFMLEARAISTLSSPYTVTVYDFGIANEGQLYFTMELLDGKPLNEVLEREVLVPPMRAVPMALQICASLAEAHEKRIWHRDIKPANIFVLRNAGDGASVKVVDFGIAKMQGSGEAITRPGMIGGTPEYSSPEQAMGETVDYRSDIYSLGATLFHMLAGRPPFLGDGSRVMMSHIRETPPDIRLVAQEPDSIPDALAKTVMWTLEKLPTRRPQSAAELASALREALPREAEILPPAGARPPPPPISLPVPDLASDDDEPPTVRQKPPPAGSRAASTSTGLKAITSRFKDRLSPFKAGDTWEEFVTADLPRLREPRGVALLALLVGVVAVALWFFWPPGNGADGEGETPAAAQKDAPAGPSDRQLEEGVESVFWGPGDEQEPQGGKTGVSIEETGRPEPGDNALPDAPRLPADGEGTGKPAETAEADPGGPQREKTTDGPGIESLSMVREKLKKEDRKETRKKTGEENGKKPGKGEELAGEDDYGSIPRPGEEGDERDDDYGKIPGGR